MDTLGNGLMQDPAMQTRLPRMAPLAPMDPSLNQFSPPMPQPMMPAPPPPPPDTSVSALGKMRRPSANKEEQLLSDFNKHLRMSSLMRSAVVDMAMKAHRQYCCLLKSDKKCAFFVKVFDPHFFATVTSTVAAEAAALLSSPSFLQYQPRGATSDDVARFFTAAFDYHWNENPRSRAAIIDTLLQRRLYGTAFGVAYWHEDWRLSGQWEHTQVDQRVPIIGPDGLLQFQNQPQTISDFVVKRKKTKDSPWYAPLNFFQCYPDADAIDVREGRFFIYRERRSLTYVKSMGESKAWFPSVVNEIVDSPGSFAGHFSDDNVSELLSAQTGFGVDAPQDSDDPMFDVWEYYTPKGRATIVGGTKVVAFREGYIGGYYPIVHLRNHSIPGEFWGMSDIQIVESQIEALQNMYSAQATQSVLQCFPPLIVADSSIELGQFNYGPGQMLKITSGNTNAVQQMTFDPGGIQTSQALCNDLRGRVDQALGSSDVARGGLPTRSQSATAVMQSTQQNQLRQGPQIITLEDDLVKQIGVIFRDLIMCCQSDDITHRLTGGDGFLVIKAEILNQDADLDTVPVTGAQRANELEQKRLLELGNLAMNFKVPTFNVEEFIKAIAEATVPRLAERIIMDPQKAMQQAQMRLAINGPEAGGPGPGNGAPGATSVSNNADPGAMTELSREQGGEMNLK